MDYKTFVRRKIEDHFRDGEYNPDIDLDRQLSNYNLRCLVGMIETGEVAYDDLESVGGTVLVARVRKLAATTNET